MHEKCVRVLMIEDNVADARLIHAALSEAPACGLILEHAGDLASGARRLSEPGIDAVLLDLSLPDSHGLETFRAMHAQAPRVPIVILSGCDDEALALSAVQSGAQDYLPKSKIDGALLIRSVRYAMERQASEDQIRALNAELESRVRQRTQELVFAIQELEAFGYSVAHDLRRPLRAIDGFSAILVQMCDERFSAREKSYFARIRRACQRMEQLIDALLTLTRLSNQDLRREPVNLRLLAREVIEELRRAEPSRAVTLEMADELAAVGDPRLLRIVVENLLGNAWKFTRARAAAQIHFASVNEEGRTVFYVRDNGAGFDVTYADKLFAPFERLHEETEFEGLGVGLAIVQRILRRHGGAIWAQGAVDRGATFFFTLQPRENAHHGHSAEDHTVGRGRSGRRGALSSGH